MAVAGFNSFIRGIWNRYPWVFTWILPLLFFAACALYYQGTLLRCTDTLMSGPGDQTAGLIWLHTMSPGSPLWGFTHISNYPYGESLHQAAQWSGALLYLVYWLLANLAGAVCGYNLLNLLGFFSAAVIMYAFVKWLTKRPLIAVLAGYAVAFTPYFQFKTTGHPSYVFQGVLVAIIWLTLKLWRSPRLSLAIGLGATLAATLYIDPYFVLFAIVLMTALLGSLIGYDLWRRVRLGWGSRLRALGLTIITALVLISPLIYVRIHDATAIDQFVGGSRNPVKFDAQIYSARPWEYFEPAGTNQLLLALLGSDYAKHRDHHISNPAEYTINLSLTLIALVIVTILILDRRALYRRRLWPANLSLRIEPGLLLTIALVLGVLAFVFSLPPTIHGNFKLPTYYLTSVISMWRVFARLYVLVNIALVLLASVALAALWVLLRRTWQRVGLVLLVFVGVAVEYQVFPIPRPVWSFRDNTPTVYYWLAQQSSIHAVAEYSLDEEATTGLPTLTRSYDTIDRKPMLNSALPASPQGPQRGSIRTLTDPQTVPALRALGIDTVITHGVSGQDPIPGLQLIRQELTTPPTTSSFFVPDGTFFPINVYHVTPGPKLAYETTLETGFVPPKFDSPIHYEYVGGNGATLDLRALPGAPAAVTSQLCFSVAAFNLPTDVMFSIAGREVWHGSLNRDTYQPVQLTAKVGEPVTLVTSRPGAATVKFTNLGCAP